jgi:hypothetical protein
VAEGRKPKQGSPWRTQTWNKGSEIRRTETTVGSWGKDEGWYFNEEVGRTRDKKTLIFAEHLPRVWHHAKHMLTFLLTSNLQDHPVKYRL